MKLPKAPKLIEDEIHETLTHNRHPDTPWQRIRTNSLLERIMKKIRRWVKVDGAFPDGHSALMFIAARLRHIAETELDNINNLSMEPLYKQKLEIELARMSLPPKVRKIFDTTCLTVLAIQFQIGILLMFLAGIQVA